MQLISDTRTSNLSWILTQLRRGVPRATGFTLLWAILTGLHPTAWGVGIPAVLIATGVSLLLLPSHHWHWHLGGLARFLPFFVWQSIRGSIDVARRALHPRCPLTPQLVAYPLRLPEGPSRIFLANTVSLLPGTLTADLEGGSLRVHTLDSSMPTHHNLQVLERRIADLFGLPLEHPPLSSESPYA